MAEFKVPETIPHSEHKVGHLTITFPTQLFNSFICHLHLLSCYTIALRWSLSISKSTLVGLACHVPMIDFVSKDFKVMKRCRWVDGGKLRL